MAWRPLRREQAKGRAFRYGKKEEKRRRNRIFTSGRAGVRAERTMGYFYSAAQARWWPEFIDGTPARQAISSGSGSFSKWSFKEELMNWMGAVLIEREKLWFPGSWPKQLNECTCHLQRWGHLEEEHVSRRDWDLGFGRAKLETSARQLGGNVTLAVATGV